MLRNTHRLEKITSEAIIKVVSDVAQAVDLMGSEKGSIELGYQSHDCEVGDLVPVLHIGVTRISQVTSREITGA